MTIAFVFITDKLDIKEVGGPPRESTVITQSSRETVCKCNTYCTKTAFHLIISHDNRVVITDHILPV